MEESISPTITLGPVTFDLTLLAMSLLTVFIVFAFVYWASRKMTLKPSGKQNVLEYLYDFVIGFTKGNIGDKYIKNYSPFIFSLFLYMSYLTTTFTVSSPTVTRTIPAGTAIVALSEVTTVSANGIPNKLRT